MTGTHSCFRNKKIVIYYYKCQNFIFRFHASF
jgi:hypothetical protein